MDRGTTGNFEVILVSTGEKIHSKAQGKCNDKKQIDAIVAKVAEHLESKTNTKK